MAETIYTQIRSLCEQLDEANSRVLNIESKINKFADEIDYIHAELTDKFHENKLKKKKDYIELIKQTADKLNRALAKFGG